jgi:hypothetical protein
VQPPRRSITELADIVRSVWTWASIYAMIEKADLKMKVESLILPDKSKPSAKQDECGTTYSDQRPLIDY